MVSGYCLTQFKLPDLNSPPLSTQRQFIVGELISSPMIKENTIKSILKVKGIKNHHKWNGKPYKAMILIEKDSLSLNLKIGDRILIDAILRPIPPPKNPKEFNYKRYLSYQLINQQCYLKSGEWKQLGNGTQTSIYVFAQRLRGQLIDTFKSSGISAAKLGIVSALVLGYKQNIDPQLKTAYSNTGVMHILAVSGLHVGIVFLVVNFLLTFLEKFKGGLYLKMILLLLVLWFYALITGLSPSVLRATTMFSFIVWAQTVQRNTHFFNTLAASAMLLLIINPYLIMDVGFQLSYIAVMGIVVIQPWLVGFFSSRYWIVQQGWKLTTVSLAAQIATSPLGLYYFHQFPNYFLLSNLLVIPLAIGTLYSGLLVLIFSPVAPLSSLLAMMSNLLVELLNGIVKWMNTLPYSTATNIRFTLLDTVFTYGIIVCIILLIRYRKFNYLVMTCMFGIFLLTSHLFNSYQVSQQQKMTIYNLPYHSVFDFTEGTNSVLISNQPIPPEKLAYHVKNNWMYSGIKEKNVMVFEGLKNSFQHQNLWIKQNYIQFHQTKMVLINKRFQTTQPTNPLRVDLVIWSQNHTASLEEVNKMIEFDQLIIDASNSYYTNKRLLKEAESMNIPCWSVIDKGAFVKNTAL